MVEEEVLLHTQQVVMVVIQYLDQSPLLVEEVVVEDQVLLEMVDLVVVKLTVVVLDKVPLVKVMMEEVTVKEAVAVAVVLVLKGQLVVQVNKMGVLVVLVSHQILMDLLQLEQVVAVDLDQVLEAVDLVVLAVAVMELVIVELVVLGLLIKEAVAVELDQEVEHLVLVDQV